MCLNYSASVHHLSVSLRRLRLPRPLQALLHQIRLPLPGATAPVSSHTTSIPSRQSTTSSPPRTVSTKHVLVPDLSRLPCPTPVPDSRVRLPDGQLGDCSGYRQHKHQTGPRRGGGAGRGGQGRSGVRGTLDSRGRWPVAAARHASDGCSSSRGVLSQSRLEASYFSAAGNEDGCRWCILTPLLDRMIQGKTDGGGAPSISRVT